MKLRLLLIISVLLLLSNNPAQALDVAGASAIPKTKNTLVVFEEKDLRLEKLTGLFETYDSPFGKEEVRVFIAAADKNNLDWRLLPAIAGIESTFGRFLPANSYNPFGWGIYGDKVTRFKSYSEAIETVAEGINQKYPYKDLVSLSRTYCPPNASAWKNRVGFFMAKLEDTAVDSQDLLAINL